MSFVQNEEEKESQKANSQKANEDIHPSKGVEVKKVQNPIVPKSIQDDLNVKNIVDVLAKLRTVNSSLEQESSKKEKMKKESFEKGREVEATPDIG